MIRKLCAVILAGGFGGRFYPFTKSVPKEMLPLNSIPTIHWILREAFRVSDRIHIIHRSDIDTTKRHFDAAIDVDDYIIYHHGIESPQHLFNSIRQGVSMSPEAQTPYGTLGPFLQAVSELPPAEAYALLFADEVFCPTAESFGPLEQMLPDTGGFDVLFTLLESNSVEYSQFGLAKVSDPDNHGFYRVSEIFQKPHTPPYKGLNPIVSRLIIRAHIISELRRTHERGETDVTVAISRLIKKHKIGAVLSKSGWFTIGDPASYAKTISFFNTNYPVQNMYEFYDRQTQHR